jgi:hypothetical protein
MTAVCTTYIFVAPEGLAWNYGVGVAIGITVAFVTGAAFMVRHLKRDR